MRNQGFTALSEIDPAVCSLALPGYVDNSRIGIHLGRIGALAAVGHLGDFRISSYFDDAPSVSPTIAGFNGNGTAVAGGMARAAAQMPMGRATLSGDSNDSRPDVALRPDVNLGVNMSDVTERVRAAGPVRDPKIWAAVLDGAIGATVRDASWRHLVHSNMAKTELIATCATGAMAGVFGTIDALSALSQPGEAVQGAIVSAGVLIIVQNIVRFAGGTVFGQHPKDICWSAVPWRHYDRAGLVSLLSRSMKLASAL